MGTEGQQLDTDIHAKVLQNTLSEVSLRSSRSDDGTDDCCVICLDALSEPCIAQPCAHHNFDFLCLASWLQERATCPLCKAIVREVRYGLSSAQDNATWKTYHVPHTGAEGNSTPALPPPDGTARDFDFDNNSSLFRRPPRPPRREVLAPPPPTSPTVGAALRRRRHVYRHGLYSLHVGANRLSRYRTLTPQMFQSDSALVSKARRWIRRELQVFDFLSPVSSGPALAKRGTTSCGSFDSGPRHRRRANNAEFLLEYVIAILKTVDTQASSGHAEDLLQEFLGRAAARLFLHELRAWLRSPYDALEMWDCHVQYDESEVGKKSFGRETLVYVGEEGREQERGGRFTLADRDRGGNRRRRGRRRQRSTPYRDRGPGWREDRCREAGGDMR